METIRTLSRIAAAAAIALAGGYAAAQSQGADRQPAQPGTTNPTTAPTDNDRLPANRTGDMPSGSGSTQSPGTSDNTRSPGTSDNTRSPGTSDNTQSPSGSTGSTSGQPDHVSVDISRVAVQLAQNMGVSESQIPTNVSLPVGVAANACGVSATDLAPLGSRHGAATCSATTAPPELESAVRNRMTTSPAGQSR